MRSMVILATAQLRRNSFLNNFLNIYCGIPVPNLCQIWPSSSAGRFFAGFSIRFPTLRNVRSGGGTWKAPEKDDRQNHQTGKLLFPP